MSRKYYVIKGIGSSFDGLVVESDEYIEDGDDGPSMVEVGRIVNRNTVIGDRSVSYLLPQEAIWISDRYLEEVQDPELREFDSTNPWGKCEFEGRYTKGSIEVSYAQYERALQVTVSEKVDGKSKTIHSCYITNDIRKMKEVIETCLREAADPDDLVFAIKAAEDEATRKDR
jgi:hypothetical protein